METNVTKWGNSFAIRIPASLIKSLKIKDGEKVTINIEDQKLIIIKKETILEDLLANIDENNLHSEINFGSQQGNEEW